MHSKNLYDFSNEELKIKLNNDFSKDYSKVYYSEENWQSLNDILDDFNNNIMVTNFPLSLYNDTKYKLSQIPNIKKESSSNKIIDDIFNVIGKIGTSIKKAYNSSKFIFSILGLTIVSIVLGVFIHLILGTFIYTILPINITPEILKAFIAGIIFIILKVFLFLEKDNDNLLSDYKKDIIKFICTIPFYGIILYVFNLIPFLNRYTSFIYPNLWLSVFTNEYIISPIICLIINCLLSVIIFLIIKKKTDN